MPLVFQYGSNCAATRLNGPQRLDGTAEDCGRAQAVLEFQIAFDVWSTGNNCAAADLVESGGNGRHVWGVLYEIPADRIYGRGVGTKKTLSQIEGPRYEARPIRVRDASGEEVDAITFTVKEQSRTQDLRTAPHYVAHIVNGLRSHAIPEEYVQYVIDRAIQQDGSVETAGSSEIALLEKLRANR